MEGSHRWEDVVERRQWSQLFQSAVVEFVAAVVQWHGTVVGQVVVIVASAVAYFFFVFFFEELRFISSS